MRRLAALATVATALLFSGSAAATIRLAIDFYTPGYTVVCNQPDGSLTCWTPNDGFTIWMYENGRVPHPASYRDRRGPQSFDSSEALRLDYGHRWRNATWSIRCSSARTGFTCRNRSGHGWWLGRYHGYRVF